MMICSSRCRYNNWYIFFFLYMKWNFFPQDLDWRIIVHALERWQDNQIICVKLWLNPYVVYSLRPGAWVFSSTVTKISTKTNLDCNTASPSHEQNTALFSVVLLTHLSFPLISKTGWIEFRFFFKRTKKKKKKNLLALFFTIQCTLD